MTATLLRNSKSMHCIHVSFEIIKLLIPNWKTNLPLKQQKQNVLLFCVTGGCLIKLSCFP